MPYPKFQLTVSEFPLFDSLSFAIRLEAEEPCFYQNISVTNGCSLADKKLLLDRVFEVAKEALLLHILKEEAKKDATEERFQ